MLATSVQTAGVSHAMPSSSVCPRSSGTLVSPAADAIDARQHDRGRAAILAHQRVVGQIEGKAHALALGQGGQLTMHRRLGARRDDGERQVGRHAANQIVHALVRQQPADEQRPAVADDRCVGREAPRVHPAADDARPRVAGMAEHRPAVLAQVQVAVKERVCGHVGRQVPPAAAEVADEDAAAERTAPRRRQRAGEHVLLVAVHDVGARQRAQQVPAHRVRALAADVPRAGPAS